MTLLLHDMVDDEIQMWNKYMSLEDPVITSVEYNVLFDKDPPRTETTTHFLQQIMDSINENKVAIRNFFKDIIGGDVTMQLLPMKIMTLTLKLRIRLLPNHRGRFIHLIFFRNGSFHVRRARNPMEALRIGEFVVKLFELATSRQIVCRYRAVIGMVGARVRKNINVENVHELLQGSAFHTHIRFANIEGERSILSLKLPSASSTSTTNVHCGSNFMVLSSNKSISDILDAFDAIRDFIP